MNKIYLIIRREYWTRVNKKSFIILTFLTPVLFAALIFVPLWLATIKDNEQKVFVILDDTGKYAPVFQDVDHYVFKYQSGKMDVPDQKWSLNKEIYAFIHIKEDLSNNPNAMSIYSEKTVSMPEVNMVRSVMEKYLENEKLASFNIPNIKEMIRQSQIKLNIDTIKIGKDGTEKESSGEIAAAVSLVVSLLIYMFIFMYGAQVMNSVSEEKTNRIVEVIISSVKPFHLMMGKILGTVLVGLTQFFLWIVFTGIIVTIVNLILGVSLFSSPDTTLPGAGIDGLFSPGNEATAVMKKLSGIDWGTLFVCFIIYFLGGYLLYSSFFAAIGAAVDTSSESQQFVLPVTLPLIFALYVVIYGIRNPEGPLFFWCSFIPFTSPIVMMARIPFEVPVWQILLSVALLIMSFIVFTWISGKIYKTGILMYGKKVSYHEIWKWLKYRS
ncbi:MAG: ABC transporter permease [Candidatus Azobacteroides sp.]|nr:ABC transporter permease [Candidatus Azobacteroides sp.]